ncbi:MAG: outer membrane protein assembly factor BamE [Solirubrobacterales bacterium]
MSCSALARQKRADVGRRGTRAQSLLFGSTASLALLALAPQAGAVIVPQQGMAGVKLGMSKGEVRAKLGKPRAVNSGNNDFGHYVSYRYRGQLTVMFQSGPTVTSVKTSGHGERTKEGVGAGSREQTVRDKFPQAKCSTLVNSRSCYIGELKAGKRVTDFSIKNGKVRWVTVGFVIE